MRIVVPNSHPASDINAQDEPLLRFLVEIRAESVKDTSQIIALGLQFVEISCDKRGLDGIQ